MSLRKKITLSYDEVSEKEALEKIPGATRFPLDKMQEWVEKLKMEQQESRRMWTLVGRIVLCEKRRDTVKDHLIEAIDNTLKLYRQENGILTEEQQTRLDQLQAEALAILNSAKTTKHGLTIEALPDSPSNPPTKNILALLPAASTSESQRLLMPTVTLPRPILTPAAKKDYKRVTSPISSGDDQLHIDENPTPTKKPCKEKRKLNHSRERKESGGSHHSYKQGRIGGRFSKKLEDVQTSTISCRDINPEPTPEPQQENRELAIVIPRVSVSKCNFLLCLKLEPS